MKKLTIALAFIIALFSCEKETKATNITTTKNTSNSIVCVDNPNINFTSIGTPIGKISECIKDVDGNIYKTVNIGNQQWMVENLKVSKYNDGTSIPNVIEDSKWSQLTTGAWVYYNNEITNNTKYGKLYNWYAVSPTTNGNKNVCPAGWHIPTDTDWTILTEYLGGDSVAGGKMKEVGKTNWNSPNIDATNASLFTGIPGGNRGGNSGSYNNIGIFVGYWSSTEKDSLEAWVQSFNYEDSYTYREDIVKDYGLSVRCLRD